MTLPIEIENRPCPDFCAEPGHKYIPDKGCEWSLTRLHSVAFTRPAGSEPMVTLTAMDEYCIGELRRPGSPDEDVVGTLAIEADERFFLDGCSPDEAREAAAKAMRLAAELLAAAARLEEIKDGGR
ncbi:hypothetical protein [Lentzea albida]|uniref:Uncharacterized protein n=1 Tax=Lentzea albida TaxID=65499 RepID=A0A1H9VJG9_9PSEU|nr:hypothetical protein [Lentzea albida]SES21343.1 hypothetical protein SAMN04488000_118141 [Lentzea albida]